MVVIKRSVLMFQICVSFFLFVSSFTFGMDRKQKQDVNFSDKNELQSHKKKHKTIAKKDEVKSLEQHLQFLKEANQKFGGQQEANSSSVDDEHQESEDERPERPQEPNIDNFKKGMVHIDHKIGQVGQEFEQCMHDIDVQIENAQSQHEVSELQKLKREVEKRYAHKISQMKVQKKQIKHEYTNRLKNEVTVEKSKLEKEIIKIKKLQAKEEQAALRNLELFKKEQILKQKKEKEKIEQKERETPKKQLDDDAFESSSRFSQRPHIHTVEIRYVRDVHVPEEPNAPVEHQKNLKKEFAEKKNIDEKMTYGVQDVPSFKEAEPMKDRSVAWYSGKNPDIDYAKPKSKVEKEETEELAVYSLSCKKIADVEKQKDANNKNVGSDKKDSTLTDFDWYDKKLVDSANNLLAVKKINQKDAMHEAGDFDILSKEIRLKASPAIEQYSEKSFPDKANLLIKNVAYKQVNESSKLHDEKQVLPEQKNQKPVLQKIQKTQAQAIDASESQGNFLITIIEYVQSVCIYLINGVLKLFGW